MDISLTNHIKELNKLTYKDQCAYIAKKLISMRPDDITHFTFLKKLQAMLINLPDAFNDFIKVLSNSGKGAFNFGFNSNVFDNYFFYSYNIIVRQYHKMNIQLRPESKII